MKRPLLLLLAVLAVMTSSFAQTISISVKKNKLNIAGASVNPDWTIQPVLNKLGTPSKSRDGYNRTHTYDGFGIVLFEAMSDKVASGTMNEFQVYLSPPAEPNNVTPSGTFSGSVKIDKLVCTASLTSNDMLKKLKGWKKTDSYIDHSYRMAKGGLYIYFQFDDSENKLIKISIGPDKKGK